MVQDLHYVKDIGLRSLKALESGWLAQFRDLMHERWEPKMRRSGTMSNPKIDESSELASKNGAIGGKFIGAGGAGFLMFYTETKAALRHALLQAGLVEVRFRFDFEDTKAIAQ